MIRQFKFTLLLLIFSVLASCSSLNNFKGTRGSISLLDSVSCSETANNIYLFNKGEAVDFSYTVIGEVNADADLGPKDFLAESRLKYEAWNNCANAAINIVTDTSSYTLANNGTVIKIKKLKGQAIKIKTDSSFFAKYGKINDLTFLEDLNAPKKTKTKMSTTTSWIYMISVTLGLLLIAVFVSFATNFKGIVPFQNFGK